jgi:poly(3-hydroxybutyrate) depolymerase
MIEKIAIDKDIDSSRVFVTGLSAGGAMTSVMLACYPEVFSAGAIIAGLPYGAANNVQQAFESMFQSPVRSAQAWGDLVRSAAPHAGPWPRISIWHGAADKTVIPANAREILKQWINVHGLPLAPSGQAMVDGYPRAVWISAAGDELIESYTIAHMAHGTPLAAGEGEGKCGVAGPFLLEVGISSSYHIAKFFGLTGAGFRARAPESARAAAAPERRHVSGATSPPTQPQVLEGEVLDKEPDGRAEHAHARPPRVDIGAVITKALTAAGLMKGR